MRRFGRFLLSINLLRIGSFLAGIVRWALGLPKGVSIPAIVVLVGVAGVGAYQGLSTWDYMQNNPNFCRSCHTMEEAWTKWSTSEHKDLTCHSCHETNVIEGADQLIKFSLNKPEKVSKHAAVQDEKCKGCHESGNSEWLQVANTAGHSVHAENQNIACVKCHAVTVHRFAPPTQICAVCHEEKKVKVTGMADNHCTSCHEFLATKVELLPGRETCLACHKAQKVQKVTWPADAPMKQECSQCHQPHEEARPKVDCLSCHKDIRTEGLHARPVHTAATCLTCHKPHEWVVKTRDSCQTCHVDKVQHNTGVVCSNCHNFKKGGK